MDFLKKHYEKVVLGVVLIGLSVAVAVLPFFISSEKDKLDQMKSAVLHPKVKPLTNLDLTLPEQALKRLATPAMIDFGPPNRVFNPMPWQKAADGHLLLRESVGPNRIVVTNIAPLYLVLTLDSVAPSDAGPKYVIGIEKQAAPNSGQRSKRQSLCSLNPATKNETFTMLEVKGPPDDPSQVVVQLNDTGEKAVITKEKPFRRIDGYTADLHYDLEKKSWTHRRANSPPPLSFNGEEYNIVAINQNEVVLSAKLNGKKWAVKANPTAAP
jgi:hypothetical protein